MFAYAAKDKCGVTKKNFTFYYGKRTCVTEYCENRIYNILNTVDLVNLHAKKLYQNND